jgi:chromosome segregation ATPase
MHIISFKIFNFKSYKHCIIREELSPGINIFVGYNGSGKTTLLQAIDCILCLNTKNTRQDQIFNVLKKSNDYKKPVSMIEILFDNSDRFFPISNDYITIRRIFDSNVDKFLLCNLYISPHQFFDFLNIKKIYFDNLAFKIQQGMHLEFKKASVKKRLQIFIRSIGLNSFDLFEKKSIEYLLKINFYKKKLIGFIERIKKKEKYFSSKLKLYKKNEYLTNQFLLLYDIYYNNQNKIFEKKKSKANYTYIEQIKIIQIIYIRLFFIIEEKKFNKFNKKKKSLTFNKKSLYIEDFLTHLTIDVFTSLIKTVKYLCTMIKISNKHFNHIKNNYAVKNIIKNNQIDLNYKNIFAQDQNSIYLKIYKIFHIFQVNRLSNYLEQPKLLFFTENILTIINCSRLKLLKLENKVYFFQREILTEIEIVKTNLFKYENHLENKLGIKVLRGIRNLLKIIKDTSILKSKIFGLVIDLILVHKHFYKAIESVLSKYFTFIVVKNKKIIFEIIKTYKEKIKTRIDFITPIHQFKVNSSLLEDKLNSNVFPIIKTVFFRNDFEMLFKKLLNNIYFIQNSIQKQVVFQKNTLVVNLDGYIFDHGGHITIGLGNQKISALEIVNLLKKNRFFFFGLVVQQKELKMYNLF